MAVLLGSLLPTFVFARYEKLGQDGSDSLYRWYRQYEAQHFPDPQHLRERLEVRLGPCTRGL